MRRYETIVILDTDISTDVRESSIDLVTGVIQRMDGFLVEVDEWGVRKLAYEIRKKPRGDYVRFNYCGMGPLVDEMERLFRINDQYLKYMTVLLEKDVDLEALKAQLAEKQAAEEAAAAEKAATQAAAQAAAKAEAEKAAAAEAGTKAESGEADVKQAAEAETEAPVAQPETPSATTADETRKEG